MSIELLPQYREANHSQARAQTEGQGRGLHLRGLRTVLRSPNEAQRSRQAGTLEGPGGQGQVVRVPL